MEFIDIDTLVGFSGILNSIVFIMRICLESRPTEFVAVQVNIFTSIVLFKCLARIDNLLYTTLSALVFEFDVHIIVGVGTPVEMQS